MKERIRRMRFKHTAINHMTADKWLVTTGAVIENHKTITCYARNKSFMLLIINLLVQLPLYYMKVVKNTRCKKTNGKSIGTDAVRNAGSDVPMAGSEMQARLQGTT